MSNTPLDQSRSIAPASEKIAAVIDFVAAKQRRSTGEETTYYLTSSTGSERVELTPELFDILKSAAQALRHGQSVAIHRRDQQVTTQQAADLLGLSRPTVVKLIDDGVLSATVPGKQRRKLQLAEVLSYRDRLHEARSEFIADSADLYSEYSADDISGALAELRKSADAPAP